MAFEITYELDATGADDFIDAIRVEQSIEFPLHLAPEWILNQVVGQVIKTNSPQASRVSVTVAYGDDVVAGDFAQFLNLLWGNVSLLKDVVITEISLPDSFLKSLQGPRFGLRGLRQTLGIESRPLLMTALKPMGLDSERLGKMAATLVEGGIDIIKDDHNLANQPWARWDERVPVIARAVSEANGKFGRRAIYAPSLNRPTALLPESARRAKELGCGALLVLPGISGFDSMRLLASDDEISLPILSHPAFLGSLVTSVENPSIREGARQGLRPGISFATLVRLAGGDVTIFPNHGGRFGFTPQQCQEVVEGALKPLGSLAPISPALAGGMTLDRVPGIIKEFGSDITLLIGGALHDGDLLANTRKLRELVENL